MKLGIKPIVAPLFLVALGAALVVQKKAQIAAERPPAVTPVVVVQQALRMGPVTLTESTVADVLAVRDAVISSRLSAYITQLPLFEGERFKRGDLLARLAMSPQDGSAAARDSLLADRAAAQATFAAAKASLQRSRQIFAIGGVSLEQLQSAEASEASAAARLAVARENLDNATVKAPFDGTVSERLAQPGDLTTPGKPLLKVVDTAAGMRLVIDAPEGRQPVALLYRNRPFPLTAWPETTAQGARRFEARVPAAGLAPGSRVAVDVVLFSGKGIFIPRDCALDGDGKEATILRVSGQKVAALRVPLAAEGKEGAVTRDGRAAGPIACASPDILARLEAGVPFSYRK